MTTSGKYNCQGSEFYMFLCLFGDVWKAFNEMKCASPHCPTSGKIRTRNASRFNFYSGTINFIEQLKKIFPATNMHMEDYCGAQFKGDPPPKSLSALNNRLVTDDKGEEYRQTYYECRGESIVLNSGFKGNTPWIIPLGIMRVATSCLNTLPKQITIP
uniref:Uncharacterized protein n=1 Tax=Amphimedon queenslandica TaxID=400682 RepID=A0A1X7UZY1_AMPQE